VANIRGGRRCEVYGGGVQAHSRRSSGRDTWGVHSVENRRLRVGSVEAEWARPRAVSRASQRKPSVDLSGAALEGRWGCHSGCTEWGRVGSKIEVVDVVNSKQ
jgi:hypothetical protein